MLFGRSRLLALSQTREDTILLEKCFSRSALDFNHLHLTNLAVRGDGIEVKVFSQDDDTGTVLEHVPGRAMRHGIDRHGFGRVVGGRGGRGRGGGNGLGDIAEELEHVLQRVWVVLRRIDIVR